jgi:tetratricopeptide (TPR) repeat protein
LVFFAMLCGAQMHEESAVRGRVTGGGLLPRDLSVELVSSRERTPASSGPVGLDGDFEIPGVPRGHYELRVSDAGGHVLASQFVDVGGYGNTIMVRLPERPVAGPAAGGTVSVTQLKRKIPSKASKEFMKAQKASAAADVRKAIEHLEKAIEIEPAYTEAYNNLGVRYLELEDPERAAGMFRKAIDSDPNCGLAFCNLAVAQFWMQRVPEAEQAARQAVKLDGTSRKSRMMLGLILAARQSADEEALENLRAAQQEYPRLRLKTAEILARQGQHLEAAGELKRYLASAKPEEASEVQTWIAQLEQHQ